MSWLRIHLGACDEPILREAGLFHWPEPGESGRGRRLEMRHSRMELSMQKYMLGIICIIQTCKWTQTCHHTCMYMHVTNEVSWECRITWDIQDSNNSLRYSDQMSGQRFRVILKQFWQDTELFWAGFKNWSRLKVLHWAPDIKIQTSWMTQALHNMYVMSYRK